MPLAFLIVLQPAWKPSPDTYYLAEVSMSFKPQFKVLSFWLKRFFWFLSGSFFLTPSGLPLPLHLGHNTLSLDQAHTVCWFCLPVTCVPCPLEEEFHWQHSTGYTTCSHSLQALVSGGWLLYLPAVAQISCCIKEKGCYLCLLFRTTDGPFKHKRK